MRIRIIKDHKEGKAGETVDVSPNVAFGLIDGGYGVVSKDMVQSDMKVTPDEEISKQEKKNGNTIKLRIK